MYQVYCSALVVGGAAIVVEGSLQDASSAACLSCCFCSVIFTESLVNPWQVLLLGE